jgi:plasmid stabilization system protein ParE
MPHVVWTDEAERRLEDVESDELFEKLLALAAGLGRFPERGWRVPELVGTPPYDIVREIILPRAARVFYLFVTDSDEVVILGFLLRGQEFRPATLGPYFKEGR